MMREVESCPHRQPRPEFGPGLAECALLHQITGVESDLKVSVARDACQACVGETPISASGFNPTLASLVYGLARRAIGAGGLPGFSLESAERLGRTAEADLALIRSDQAIVRQGAIRDPARTSRTGLIGWNTPSGLGQLNRDLARHLPNVRWLIPPHPRFREDLRPPPCPVLRGTEVADLEEFLDGLDRLIFCEFPYLPKIVPMARERGIRVVFVPMWEFLDEMADWLGHVDLMICPTRHAEDVVIRCRERLGMKWEIERIDWPIDLEQFPYRHRPICKRFLFVNGVGGMREWGMIRATGDGRKGAGIVAQAAWLAPGIPILVRSQTPILPEFPPWVEVRVEDLDDPAELYAEGDVCIQPSRWEGLGLPMLECQASGLPLVTTDGPPMKEHRPIRVLSASLSNVHLFSGRLIPKREVDPADLALALRELWGSEIGQASAEARSFVESEHSWAVAGPKISRWL